MASKRASKYMYKVMSPGYDILDKTFFRDNGKKDGRNPRDVLAELIPDEKCRVLDMCCGTGSNGIGVAIRKSQVTVVELDRSKSMLLKARQKVNSLGLRNVKIICRDATDTGLKDELFDYIIIGLALHECNPDLWKGILSEVYRLLKKDGHLIVLDWERQKGISNKIKFAPMYITESIMTPKYFLEYFNSDKEVFFSRFGFKMEKNIRCKYTFVMSLKKDELYIPKRKTNEADKAIETENDVEKNSDASYLAQTHMLDYDNYKIQELIRKRGWRELPEFERIRSIYNYIRDEIRFGYNVDDSIPASKVLKDGYGQCNTKGTLFMALLRAVGVPCRVHGFTIRKELQEGAMTGFVYKQAPKNIFHSWVEVYLEGKWYELEAFIID
nr:methyltransferase domain-containing protein [Eubacterium sp.]